MLKTGGTKKKLRSRGSMSMLTPSLVWANGELAPDFGVSLMWLKKAAALGHSASLEWLSSIHGCESEASEFGVPVDIGLSVQCTEKSARASGWDGRKGSELSIRPHLSQFALYKAFLPGNRIFL